MFKPNQSIFPSLNATASIHKTILTDFKLIETNLYFKWFTIVSSKIYSGDDNVAPNPFLCTLYLNKIGLNQKFNEVVVRGMS